MSDLTRFRDHCREMATAEHKPECPSLTAREPYRSPWVPIDGDYRNGLRWAGPLPKWEPPKCPGCNSDADRELFARLATEVDDYLDPHPTLWGDV